MAYVVTQACIDIKHTSCVDVCPVDAFREGPEMLFIDPDVCIECNACLTECPERAIYPESAVPADMQHFIALNRQQAQVYPVIRESVQQAAQTSASSTLAGRFAVVGSGPSGFYAAEALLKHMPTARVDIFERLPTPFGLVRYGVAPDHPRIKSVSAGFERIADSPQVRFFGNVAIGPDLSTADLRQHYHAVIYATGGSKSRPLAIPGAQLDNIFGASEFVGWYNGHPDHQQLTPELNGSRALIIGMGNVALDIARILVLPHDQLAQTDIADPALLALRDGGINEVCLLARRGAVQAAFTPKELEQLMAMSGVELVIDPADLQLDAASEAQLALPQFSEAAQNIALLRRIATRQRSASHEPKRIRFMFCSSPMQITATTDHKQVQVARNRLQRDELGQLHAVATDQTETLDAGLIINATGYQGEALDGLPFDSQRGVMLHHNSRIQDEASESPQYVTGWIKRGANGVIGSNKHCAAETVTQLLSALPGSLPPVDSDIEALLSQKSVEFVSFADWRLLDQHEQQQGRQQGRPRRKETDVTRMLEIIRHARTAQREAEELQASLPVQTHKRSCTLCEAMCGLQIEYQGDKILSVAGDPEDSHSSGHICPKGYALQDLHNDPDRLQKPLHKVDGQWQEVSWEAALDIAAEGLAKVQLQYGNDAVAGYWGNPTSHNLGLMLATGKLRKALGSRNIFSAASLDQMPHQLTSYLMFGHAQMFTIPDIDRTRYLLMLGANPAASNGSLMSAGNVLDRLQAIRARGGKVVLIDPRKNESALYATEHHFIRPATDALLLIGMLQHIIRERLYRPGRLREMVDQWETLLALFEQFSLAEIAPLCGIAESEIVRLAEEFAAAETAICYGRMGISAQAFGALNHWLINLLNIVTGNLDRPGGMMFTEPAADMALKASAAGSFATYHSRVRGLPEFNRELPTSVLAEEILTPGAGQVKGFICLAGNPSLSSPNSRQLDQALAQLDFMVSVDFYLNETSRHADIILPPTGPLEHEQYDLVFNLLAVHNVAKYSEPLFAPTADQLCDWDILQGLALRLTAMKQGEPVSASAPPTTGPTPVQIIDYALQNGPYGQGFEEHRNGEMIRHERGLSVEVLKKFPSGLDLGPLRPRLPEHLFTPEQKIRLLPQPLVDDLQRLQQQMQQWRNEHPLLLIGRRDLRTNNSWMHNSQRLVKGKDRCALFMHPADARTHGLPQHSRAQISSRVGKLEVQIDITEDVMPGVVCLPHGWGHDRDGIALRVAQTNPGINSNDLSDELAVDSVSGNAVLNGIPVTVAAMPTSMAL